MILIIPHRLDQSQIKALISTSDSSKFIMSNSVQGCSSSLLPELIASQSETALAEITVVIGILLTSLAPSSYWEFNMRILKLNEGARDVNNIRVAMIYFEIWPCEQLMIRRMRLHSRNFLHQSLLWTCILYSNGAL